MVSNKGEISRSCPSMAEARRKPQGFLSSVFSSVDDNADNCNDSNPDKTSETFWTQSGKSGFFSSVLSSNHSILTGLSSKLEAALNLSLDVLDSDHSSKSGDFSSKTSPVQDASSSSISPRRSSLPLSGYSKAADTYYYVKQHRARTARRKDRSVYGQPEVDLKMADWKTQPLKETSFDSLDTVDSDLGIESSSTQSSIITKRDPFYVFRNTDSVGLNSESDAYGHSTSLDSSDAESIPEGRDLGLGRSGSGGSIQSWTSSCDSQLDEFGQHVIEFMKTFVLKIFDGMNITYEEKARFGEICQHESGRLWFSRYVNAQRVHKKQVNEFTFYSLVQYFAIVLFECADADDFSPAKSLMNMCFTFFYKVKKEGSFRKEYLYTYLKDQPIWHSLRFWNAAFFDAVQCERVHRAIPTREDLHEYSPEEMSDEKSFQENITFGQLGTFTYNMYSFGLSKGFCKEFLRKQCTIANLPEEQMHLLRENMERLFQK